MVNTILIVEDQAVNRNILKKALEKEYKILEAEDGEQGLQMIMDKTQKISLVLLDIKMPKKDGIQVLQVLNEKNIIKRLPVIIITAAAEVDTVETAYRLGAAEVIAKPFAIGIIRQRIRVVIELYTRKNKLEKVALKKTLDLEQKTKELQEKTERLQKVNERLLDIMGTVVEYRGLDNSLHVKRVKEYTRIIGSYVAEYYKEYELNPKKVNIISAVASMHDIGKIVIPDAILLKAGKETEDEIEVLKSHTTKGCEIVEAVKEYVEDTYYNYCYEIIRHHHEKYNGAGYPDGLEGDAIPISAQIVSIADYFDTLISDDIKTTPIPIEKAEKLILEDQYGFFSPKILECFKMALPQLEEIVNQYQRGISS